MTRGKKNPGGVGATTGAEEETIETTQHSPSHPRSKHNISPMVLNLRAPSPDKEGPSTRRVPRPHAENNRGFPSAPPKFEQKVMVVT